MNGGTVGRRRARNAGLLLCYLVLVTAANILLKRSSQAPRALPFIVMFAAGNLAGFAGVLAYTAVLRMTPLHIAFPLSRGLVVLGIQLFAALVVFREAFALREVAGIALVTAGIILVGLTSERSQPAGPGQPAGQGQPSGPGQPP